MSRSRTIPSVTTPHRNHRLKCHHKEIRLHMLCMLQVTLEYCKGTRSSWTATLRCYTSWKVTWTHGVYNLLKSQQMQLLRLYSSLSSWCLSTCYTKKQYYFPMYVGCFLNHMECPLVAPQVLMYTWRYRQVLITMAPSPVNYISSPLLAVQVHS